LGIEILANSLNLGFPRLSFFDQQDAIKFMDHRGFDISDALVSAIQTPLADIDKLFCAFY
jgi:hypothetical protein